MSVDQLKNHTLFELERTLLRSGHNLKDYKEMSFLLDEFFIEDVNNMVNDKLRYDRSELAKDHQKHMSTVTDEQRTIYETIFHSALLDSGAVFFVYEYDGTGKTFIWKTLSAGLRSMGDIVRNVASSGIASLLLPGGRTAHSRFAIPLTINEDYICNISKGSQLAELIVQCKLIIWDEAPMMYKHCFETLDRSLRDIIQLKNPLSNDQPFGGKTVVFGGDFRQILHVIPKGNRPQVVNATINSSYLWRHVKVLRLTKNMRLENLGSMNNCSDPKEFAEWVAAIGDGLIGGDNDGCGTIELPEDINLKFLGDPVAGIVKSTYLSAFDGANDLTYLQDRAILAPTNDIVESVNDYMMSFNQQESKVYLSSDSTCKSESIAEVLNDVHSTEFLNGLKCSGLPNHKMTLKVGSPVMLIRNIDPTIGLCNETRLVLSRLGTHVLEAQILSGKNIGEKVLIPRMSITPSDTKFPFKFQHRQFPIIVSYAMTINKS